MRLNYRMHKVTFPRHLVDLHNSAYISSSYPFPQLLNLDCDVKPHLSIAVFYFSFEDFVYSVEIQLLPNALRSI